MAYKIKVNGKPILLRDREAILLAKKRAKAEGRSAANAVAQIIIENFKEGSHNEDSIC